MAATELWIATGDNYYRDQARMRAGNRPFRHASDAGMPIVSLIRYLDKEQDDTYRPPALETIDKALAYNLRVTGEVANPFGYARQTFKFKKKIKDGFFIPHGNETGWWWQGENARLASLATAALLGRRFAPQTAAALTAPCSSRDGSSSTGTFSST